MFAAGSPFDLDPDDCLRLMRAFSQAWAEERALVEADLRSVPIVPPGPGAEPPPPQDVLTSEVSLEAFRHVLVDHVDRLHEEAKDLMRSHVAKGTLEGWAEFNEAERGIVRDVLGPPREATSDQQPAASQKEAASAHGSRHTASSSEKEKKKKEESKKDVSEVAAEEDRPTREILEEREVGQEPARNGA
jgi:hypothetical protein